MLDTNLIGKTDFENAPLYLLINDNNESTLNGIVKDCQNKYGEKLVGSLEWSRIKDDFLSGETTPQTQKYINFIDGSTYQINGNDIVWAGFKNLLRYFVYFQFRNYMLSIQEFSGETINNNENSTVIIPKRKLVSIYNEGVEIWGNGLEDAYKSTAYNYLYNNSVDFADLNFTILKKINAFNL